VVLLDTNAEADSDRPAPRQVLAILAVGAFLWLTLVRFNYVSALFARCGGFSLPCPLWRAFPAVAAEVASVLLLLVVLTRCESE
jgi:hypothetical protein